MAGFTTTSDGSWTFKFSDTPEAPDLPVHDPFTPQGPEIASYLSGPGKWENYSDMVVYELDSLVRKFLESKLDDKQWTGQGSHFYRKYTCGLMFEQIYGHPCKLDDHDERVRLQRLSKVLAYYSTRIQKNGSIRGKNYSKSIYTLSLQRYKKVPPYSLRLRVEWLAEQGKLPTWHNMKLPKDDLKAGHARNPRTNENMRRRRERAREEYYERYKRNREA